MKRDPRDEIAAVARKMRSAYGKHAVALMETRARNHLRHNELEGAKFWQQVAEAVRELNAGTS
jgi:hypothetical protein